MDYKIIYTVDVKDKWVNGTPTMGTSKILNLIEDFGEGITPAKHLMYFKRPHDTPLNLNHLSYRYTHRNQNNMGRIRLIEYFLMHNNCNRNNIGKVYVYAVRGALLKIMQTPFSKFNWKISVTRFQNCIYLTFPPDHEGERNSLSQAYPFIFRRHCFADSPNEEPNINVPVNENNQTYGIFSRTFDECILTYSAEICGVLSENPIKDLTNINDINSTRFVGMKLLKEEEEGNWTTHPKIFKLWCQSYLVGAKDNILGFKDKKGYVKKPIKHVNLEELTVSPYWNPNSCIEFLKKMLKIIIGIMSEDCPYTVYEFSFDGQHITYKILKGRTKKTFLSDEFIDYIKKR